MPATAVTLEGKFTANLDTQYTVEIYKENIEDNDYTKTSETKTGKTDTQASVTPETIAGFTYDSENINNVTSGNIAGNGSLVLKLYYKRIQSNVTYAYASDTENNTVALPATASYKYGATVTVAGGLN